MTSPSTTKRFSSCSTQCLSAPRSCSGGECCTADTVALDTAARSFYVFTTAVHTGILGAMVTFAGAPLYGVYLAPRRPAASIRSAGRRFDHVGADRARATTLGIALAGRSGTPRANGYRCNRRGGTCFGSHASHTRRD
jgi:hypothetical protein